MHILWLGLIACLQCTTVPNCTTPSQTNTNSGSSYTLPTTSITANSQPTESTSQQPALVESDIPDLLKVYQTIPRETNLSTAPPATTNAGPVLRSCPTSTANTQPFTDVSSQHIETHFEGQTIDFNYTNWTLVPESVCQAVNQNDTSAVNCKKAAKQLFQRLCDQLPLTKDIPDDQLPLLTNLYCQAAQNFAIEEIPNKIPIAQISISQPQLNSLQNLRQICNDFILKAMIAESFHNIRERDKHCAAYYKALHR